MTHGGALLCVFFQVHFVGQNVEEFVFLPVLEPLLRLCGAELRHMEQQVRPTPATTRGLGGHIWRGKPTFGTPASQVGLRTCHVCGAVSGAP